MSVYRHTRPRRSPWWPAASGKFTFGGISGVIATTQLDIALANPLGAEICACKERHTGSRAENVATKSEPIPLCFVTENGSEIVSRFFQRELQFLDQFVHTVVAEHIFGSVSTLTSSYTANSTQTSCD